MEKSYKGGKGLTRQKLTPVTRVKKRARGRSFQPGNGWGAEYRFKKGMPSANPSGRPLSKEISKALKQRLASDKPIPAKTGAEKIAKEWYEQGVHGNIAAIVSLANRVEGCPATAVTVNEGRDTFGEFLEAMAAEHARDKREFGSSEAPLLEGEVISNE